MWLNTTYLKPKKQLEEEPQQWVFHADGSATNDASWAGLRTRPSLTGEPQKSMDTGLGSRPQTTRLNMMPEPTNHEAEYEALTTAILLVVNQVIEEYEAKEDK